MTELESHYIAIPTEDSEGPSVDAKFTGGNISGNGISAWCQVRSCQVMY